MVSNFAFEFFLGAQSRDLGKRFVVLFESNAIIHDSIRILREYRPRRIISHRLLSVDVPLRAFSLCIV